MKKIKSIGPKSLAKISCVLYGFMGLIGGVIFLVTSLFIGKHGIFFGIAAVILLPLFYGLMGFIVGYISAYIYNFIAKKVGGIDIEIE